MIYYIVGLILTLNYIYSDSKLKKSISKKAVLKIEMLILTLFAGLRSTDVGTDTFVYCSLFEDIAYGGDFGQFDRFEAGYKLFVRLVATFTDNPHIFIFLTSVVIYAGIYIFIKNNSESPMLSMLLFYLIFFCNSLNISRQYMGMAIAINSLTYIKQKKYIKALLLILTGASFHTACLILLGVLVLSHFNRSYKWIVGLFCFSVLSTVFYDDILSIIVRLFPTYGFYFGNLYIREDDHVGRLTILISIMLLWSIIKYRKKYLHYFRIGESFNDVSNTILIFETMIMACFIGIMGSRFIMLNRISEILNVFVILMIPKMVEGSYRNLYCIGIISIFFFYMYYVINFGGIGVDPYSMLR